LSQDTQTTPPEDQLEEEQGTDDCEDDTEDAVCLDSPAAIRDEIQRVLEELRSGAIGPQKARLLLYGFQCATAALKAIPATPTPKPRKNKTKARRK